MKILFLSQIVPYPPHGGVLQRGYNLISEIAKYNSVHLLAFVHPDVLKTHEEVQAARQELQKYCAKVEFFDLWVKKSNFTKYRGLIGALFSSTPFGVHAHRSRAFSERVIQLAEKKQFDVIHYDTIFLCQFDLGSNRICRVLTHHNIESKLMERRANFEKNPIAISYLWLQAKRLRKYEARETGKYDGNIVVSDADGEELKRINPEVKVSVVPNGVDTKYFMPGKENRTPSLIYTGGMNMFANKDAVLYFLKDIWPAITAKRPNVKFYAVGQDPPTELIRIGKSDRRVVVTGYVDDIRPFVVGSSAYVVPLRVGGGTRLKILDAMAMGKAIVSTSIGCEGLEVSDGKNIIISDTPGDFAEKTIELLRDKERRNWLGSAARELVEDMYSWEMIGKNLQQVYERSIERSTILSTR
jgi:sugar transferase (PEP-CTERM/EpsH1 system associated)